MKSWQIALITAFVLASLGVFHLESPEMNEFETWKVEFGQKFTPEEESFRKIIFNDNLLMIQRHNADSSKSYKMGVNQFTHLTAVEFQTHYLNSIYYEKNNKGSVNNNEVFVEPLREIDWQALGKVTPVKDQGLCDAGYAFCSNGLMESYYLFNNKNVSLSEQQIIDCSADYTTFGCQGGSRNGTLIYIREKGLSTAAEYPYKGVKGNCQKPSGDNKPAYTHAEFNGCNEILTNLYNAPMTVAVNAKNFQTYKSGIFDGCTSTEVNHDTYLIGANQGYWRIKNSWGLRWGEYGYMRLKSGNTCGICEKPGFSWKK